MKIKFILFLFIILAQETGAQKVLFQDIYRGGITGGGYIPYTLNDAGTIPINIPSGSTIRKVFLLGVIVNEPLPNSIVINGTSLQLNASLNLEINAICTHATENHKPFILEITDIVNFSTNTINIIPPQNQNIQEGYFNNFFIVIEYENSLFSVISTTIVENLNKCIQSTSFTISNLNNIVLTDDVNFVIKSTTLCSTSSSNPDGTFIKVNGYDLGLIGGIDSNNNGFLCAGVNGSIDYQNGLSYNLGDDTADNLMDSTDATANIQSYLGSTNSIFFEFEYQTTNAYASSTNQIEELFLNYSTPCDAFSISVPSDTSICRGDSLQLNVAGGSSYEWQPATNLSCSTCPNPVFTGDSTQLYTVRIWNNDSCSVVRPVKISVRNQPNFGNVNLTPTICGTNSGSIVTSSLNGNVAPISFMVNNGVPQASGSFSNLSEGTHTITLIDGNGCMRDSVVAIDQVNNTLAQFSANPNSGAVPFSVSLSNSSVFADQFLWSLNGVSQGSAFTNFTATQTGSYLIELIAWQFDPACADTATLTITAFDSLMVQVPNIITPNDDHINDFFTLTTNLPLKGTVSILNRWGEVVFTYKGKFQQGETVLWDGKFGGKNITECTYFYGIELSEDPEFPLAIDKSQLPFKLEGFVEVRR